MIEFLMYLSIAIYLISGVFVWELHKEDFDEDNVTTMKILFLPTFIIVAVASVLIVYAVGFRKDDD